MLLRAISDLNINKKSFMIGDTVNDLILQKQKLNLYKLEKNKINNIIKYKNLKDAIDSI